MFMRYHLHQCIIDYPDRDEFRIVDFQIQVAFLKIASFVSNLSIFLQCPSPL